MVKTGDKSKRKSYKRKTYKRKTYKRKTYKRKTYKRKTYKRKTYKRKIKRGTYKRKKRNIRKIGGANDFEGPGSSLTRDELKYYDIDILKIGPDKKKCPANYLDCFKTINKGSPEVLMLNKDKSEYVVGKICKNCYEEFGVTKSSDPGFDLNLQASFVRNDSDGKLPIAVTASEEAKIMKINWLLTQLLMMISFAFYDAQINVRCEEVMGVIIDTITENEPLKDEIEKAIQIFNLTGHHRRTRELNRHLGSLEAAAGELPQSYTREELIRILSILHCYIDLEDFDDDDLIDLIKLHIKFIIYQYKHGQREDIMTEFKYVTPDVTPDEGSIDWETILGGNLGTGGQLGERPHRRYRPKRPLFYYAMCSPPLAMLLPVLPSRSPVEPRVAKLVFEKTKPWTEYMDQLDKIYKSFIFYRAEFANVRDHPAHTQIIFRRQSGDAPLALPGGWFPQKIPEKLFGGETSPKL